MKKNLLCIRFFLVVFLSVGTLSCGKSLTVNFAEFALTWQADKYFDINQKQHDQIKTQFRNVLKKVNSDPVPAIEKVILGPSLLSKTCPEIQNDFQLIKPLVENIQSELSRASHPLLDSLSIKQISYFISKSEEKIRKDQSESKETERNLKKRIEATIDMWEELFDELSVAQLNAIEKHLSQLPDISDLFLQNRLINLARLKKKSADESEFKLYLKNYVTFWKSNQSPQLLEALEMRQQKNELFFINFFCQASTIQKKNFQKTISDYLEIARKVYIN